MRQNRGRKNDDMTATYKIADLDVVNYTNKVKGTLSKHFRADSAIRYGSSTAQVTLASLAGAAETAGWSVSTASGLGLGAGYIFSLGQIFNTKDKAQAYEQAFTAVQAAEATYYFHRLGMTFATDGGRTVVVSTNPEGRSDVPSSTNLTPDGETLYYRVSKTLKVLNDTLASRIPDLQDLKDATGDTSTAVKPPAKSGDAPTSGDVADMMKRRTNPKNLQGSTGKVGDTNNKAKGNGETDGQDAPPKKDGQDSNKLGPSDAVIGGGGDAPVTITPKPKGTPAPSH